MREVSLKVQEKPRKTMLQHWCQRTSINGILDLYESKSKRSHFIFWLFTMLTMMILTIYLIAMNFVNFITSPTVINIATISSNNLSTPDLLLCYNGGFNRANMLRFNMSENLIKILNAGFFTINESLHYDLGETEFRTLLTGYNNDVDSFYKNALSYECHEIVLERNRAGEFMQTAGCQDVSRYVGKNGIPCLLMQHNGYQKWPNPADGGIRLRIKAPEGATIDEEATNDTELLNSFSLVVDSNFIVESYNKIEIPLKFRINILLSLTKYIRLPKGDPCRVCPNFTSSNACFYRCKNQAVLETCNCTLMGCSTPELDPDTRTCSVFDFYNCLRLKDIWVEKALACTNSCIPLCEEVTYQVSVSYTPLPESRFGNTSYIVIGYSYMQYTKIEEVDSFTWDVAIANIGGQAGLWMGCSIVTVIQGLFYTWLHVCRKSKDGMNEIKKKSMKKQSTKT